MQTADAIREEVARVHEAVRAEFKRRWPAMGPLGHETDAEVAAGYAMRDLQQAVLDAIASALAGKAEGGGRNAATEAAPRECCGEYIAGSRCPACPERCPKCKGIVCLCASPLPPAANAVVDFADHSCPPAFPCERLTNIAKAHAALSSEIATLKGELDAARGQSEFWEDTARRRMTYAKVAEARVEALTEEVERKNKALERARGFIRNGIALGYIRMPDPDTPDTAHEVPDLIDRALSPVGGGGGSGASAEFTVGQRVEKYTGEARWSGVIVASYLTTKGSRRYVVEVEPQGFQMIAVGSQLRGDSPAGGPAPKKTPPDPSPGGG